MRRREIVLAPTWPNVGTAAVYRRRLREMIKRMAADYEREVRAAYRENKPAMARDSAASDLADAVRKLAAKWRTEYTAAAPKLAKWFMTSVHKRTESSLMKILRDAGIAIPFLMTREMRDALDATIEENVALIRSIPEEYHTQVQALVMQSVKAGRDLSTVSRLLRKRYGVSERRAALIARDQNNKATAAMMAARQISIGIDEGVWLHSHAGKEPRPTHVAKDGQRFDVRRGWFDPDKRVRRRIWPGELINCRCTWKPVVKGFT